ncbi:hypothetical protein G3M48_000186 [Beauveria asiatica]|uniref:Aminotransferase class V domain-containing protein n=1 Tax=Beauveria asiatica TaxID=1069075 RepID=A0AAW0S1V8_9HYPO
MADFYPEARKRFPASQQPPVIESIRTHLRHQNVQPGGLTHASNILGTVTDVHAITDLAHGVGALVCVDGVDGVAFAPHRPVDVRALGVDFYVFSWYKVYGPHVIKVLKRILPLSSERNK